MPLLPDVPARNIDTMKGCQLLIKFPNVKDSSGLSDLPFQLHRLSQRLYHDIPPVSKVNLMASEKASRTSYAVLTYRPMPSVIRSSYDCFVKAINSPHLVISVKIYGLLQIKFIAFWNNCSPLNKPNGHIVA